MRSVVRETRGTGLVAVQVWVRAGSRYETNRDAGASHLIETLAMEASKNYPPAPRAGGADGAGVGGGGATGAIEALGGVATSQTARDATNYGATVAASFLPDALRALSDAVLRPLLTDAEIEIAKAEAGERLQRRAIDPVATAADLAYQTAFTKHPYRRPANGSSTSIESLNGARVRAYHAARYVGANISVIVVGDVRAAAAHALIARHFAAAPPTKPAAAPVATETAPAARKTVTRRGPFSRALIALAFRSPGIASPRDVVAMDVLLAHWGEGREAALRRVLRGEIASSSSGDGEDEESGEGDSESGASEPLALFEVGYLTQRDPGLFIVSLLVAPENRAQAVGATMAEIARVRASGINATDLARAKTELKRQYIQQSETVTGQAGALGFYEMIADYRFAVTYLERIERITAADVKAVAAKYLSGNAYVQAALEPAPRPRSRPRPRDDGGITA